MGSKPFTMSAEDWKKVGIGAGLAMLGGLSAYVTAHVIPLLNEKTANELGALLVALAATAMPILVNMVRKWAGDNGPPVKLMVIGLGLVLACAGTGYAAEFQGATKAVISGSLLTMLTADPLLMAAILVGVCLVASKLLKIDLSKFILPIVTSLLKPPGPTTPAVPGPVIPVAPNETPAILQMLIQMLLQAKSSGDPEQEAAALKLLERFRTN
jgi:hypothetical protein